MEGPQKLKMELPYDAAIPVLGIYLKKTKALNSKRSSSLTHTVKITETT